MKILFKFSLLLSLTLFTIDTAYSQTKLSVQGVIRLSDGNAIEDGLYPITFKLYDAETGGTELWSETQPTLKVTSGIYSTILGEVNPLNLQFNDFYYLSLTVEGEELLPRAPLTSAPYSNSVLGFDNVFPSTGNVGIGTLNPTESLEVNGNIKADNLLSTEAFSAWLTNASDFTGSSSTTATNLKYTDLKQNSNSSVFSMNNSTGELTILKAGVVNLSAQFDFINSSGSGWTIMDISWNGTLQTRPLASNTGTWATIQGHLTVKVSAGDTISFIAVPSQIDNMDNGIYSTLSVQWTGVD